MSAKNAAQETAPYLNINIKGAEINGSWAIYFGLSPKRALGGTITETSFTITLHNEDKKITLEIKNAKGEIVYKDSFVPTEDLSIDLISLAQKEDEGKKFLTNTLGEQVQQRKKGLEQGEEPTEGKQVTNKLQEEVQKNKGERPKKSFWDKLR